MPKVNLWELITHAARRGGDEHPRGPECKAICEDRGPRFGSELSLECVDGVWTVEIFALVVENSVSLTVQPSGTVRVTRKRMTGDTSDERSIVF